MISDTLTSPVDVFINCPFDDEYAKTFQGLIFAVHACGFRPRSAREVDDGGEPRIEKLVGIMRSCRYGIHDISRTELDRNKLPRFNMPFELGVFFGAKRFGAPSQRHKRLLILDTKQYRYQKFISDLAGMDIHAHNGSHERAMGETRDWLATVARRQLLSRRHLIRLHRRFRHDLPALADELGLDVAKLAYVDFERFVAGWLFEAAS